MRGVHPQTAADTRKDCGRAGLETAAGNDAMTTPFWPDHSARCRECGRTIALKDAAPDGWREIAELSEDQKLPGRGPFTVSAICWRCNRTARVEEMEKRG